MGAERCPYPVWSRICSPGLKRDVVEIRVLPVPLSLEPCLWSEPSGAELSSYCMIVTASGGQQWIASFLPCKYVLNVGVPQRCWYACASSTRKGKRNREDSFPKKHLFNSKFLWDRRAVMSSVLAWCPFLSTWTSWCCFWSPGYLSNLGCVNLCSLLSICCPFRYFSFKVGTVAFDHT